MWVQIFQIPACLEFLYDIIRVSAIRSLWWIPFKGGSFGNTIKANGGISPICPFVRFMLVVLILIHHWMKSKDGSQIHQVMCICFSQCFFCFFSWKITFWDLDLELVNCIYDTSNEGFKYIWNICCRKKNSLIGEKQVRKYFWNHRLGFWFTS